MKRISIRPPLFFVVAFLMLTMVIGPWGQFVAPAYAEGEGDFGRICFNGDKDYEWAHFYNVDSVNDSLSLDALNITVLNGDGSEKDQEEYELSIEKLRYDEEQDREVGDRVDPPFGIDNQEEGFTEYRAIATSTDDEEVWCEGNFVVMDIHSLAFVCADIGVEPGTATWYDRWRMHHRYWFNPRTDINFVVKHTGVDVALTEDTDYEVKFYRVARPEDMDDNNVPFEDIIVPDAEFLVTDNEGQPAQPTEPGSYFARITGINDYYGENDVLIDIDSIPRIVFRSGGEHELWSDGDLTYDVDIPDGVDGDLWIGVGVRGEDRWEVLFNDEQNPAEFFEYNDQSGELTLHGGAIFEAIGDRGVNIYASITKEGEEDNLLAEGFADADVREAKYEYELPEDDALLPEWTGWIDNKFHVYIENKQYPEGRDWDLDITDARINSNPADAIKLYDRGNGWEYKAHALGSATITLEYEDIDGTAKEHSFEVVASDHVYRADFWPVEGINQGLPGTSIELQADAEHNFIRYDEEDHNNWWHDNTREGLKYHWSIEGSGTAFATITQDVNDPTKATLTFNDLPEGWEGIGEQIDVKLSVTDTTNTDGPNEERASEQKDFWVCSDYMQIMPALIDSDLDVGKSMTIEPKLWRYQLDQDPELIEEADFKVENYDPNAIDVAETKDGFTITRKVDWDTDFNIRAYFRWEDGRPDDRDQGYHLNSRDYRIEFPYEDIKIYSDQEALTLELTKEEMDGLDNDVYQIEYTVGTWDHEAEEWTYIMDSDKYDADSNGITLSGIEINDENLDGVNVHAELYLTGQEDPKCDAWVWVELNREPCKDEDEDGEVDHHWLKATIKEATCHEKGKEIWCCLSHQLWHGCGEVRIVETDPLDHNIVKVAAKDSTLTATGNKEHYRCTLCGDLFSDAAGANPITPASVVVAKKINISGATVAAIPKKTYNRAAQKPALTVKYGSTALKAGTDYTVAYSNNTNAGTAKATLTGKGKYAGTKTVTFTIAKANISSTTIAKIANKTYNKKAQTPALTVKHGDATLKAGTDYTVAYSNNTNVGTAKATITGKGNYTGTKAVTFTIVKAANPMALKAKTATVKYASLSKANQTVKQTAACAVSGAQGKVTWKKSSGNAGITVASNGNIAVKKGLKKGSYKVTINATAAGNANYKALTKAVTVTIAVK